MLKRARDAAGLESVPLTAHKFRHTFARTWLENGGEVMHLSHIMGHSSVKITEVYLDDFQSRQARTQHTKYSPVKDLRLPKPGHGHHRYRRKRHPVPANDASAESGSA
jgi:integrase